MANNRITIVINGKEEDGGDVRFDDFIKQLAAIRRTLSEVDEDISKSTKPSVYYRVVDLRHQSPATIELEGVSLREESEVTPELVLSSFVGGINAVQEGREPEVSFSYSTLQSIKELVSFVGDKVTGLTISQNGTSLALSKTISSQIDEILGQDRISSGSAKGKLDQINLHSGNVFTIYPILGGKIRCVFPNELLEEVQAALGRYVTVSGRLKYKKLYKHPYEVQVQKIKVHPGDEDLPKLSDLWGLAPDVLEGKSVEDYIWELRNEQ